MARICTAIILIIVCMSVSAQSGESTAHNIGIPAWLPDSSGFLLPVDNNLWLISVDGSQRELIVSGESFYGTINFSPDGTQIIFHHDGDVWMSNYLHFAPMNITASTDLFFTYIQWHPSGNYFLLQSETSIQRYDINTNRLEEIISLEEIEDTNNFNSAQYSPDGEYIIVNRNDLWGGIAGVPIDDLWLFDSEGNVIQRVYAIGSYLSLDWLADSQHLVSIGYGIYSRHAAIVGLIEISEEWESHTPYEPEYMLIEEAVKTTLSPDTTLIVHQAVEIIPPESEEIKGSTPPTVLHLAELAFLNIDTRDNWNVELPVPYQLTERLIWSNDSNIVFASVRCSSLESAIYGVTITGDSQVLVPCIPGEINNISIAQDNNTLTYNLTIEEHSILHILSLENGQMRIIDDFSS